MSQPIFSDQLCVDKLPAMETAEAMERVICARESWRSDLFPGLAALREETCCTDTRYVHSVTDNVKTSLNVSVHFSILPVPLTEP